MKKQSFLVVLSIVVGFALIQYSCKKSSSSNTSPTKLDSISTTDANALQSAIIIQGASQKSGSMPTQSSSSMAPVINNNQSSAGVSPGYQFVMPFFFRATGGVSKVLFHVQGATNGYLEIGNLGSSLDTGMIGIPVTVPARVKYGYFSVVYVIVDNSGLVSDSLVTIINLYAPLDCSTATVNGADGLTFTVVDMTGKKAQNISINYDTYVVPDRIDVYQNGVWLTGTGSNPNSTIPPQCNCSSPLPGFVGQSGTLTFPFDPAKSSNITVAVSGCLGGGTAWTWTMVCN